APTQKTVSSAPLASAPGRQQPTQSQKNSSSQGRKRRQGHPRDLPSAEDEGERRLQQPRLALGSEPLEEPASVDKTATKTTSQSKKPGAQNRGGPATGRRDGTD
ncbi:unnamed protein product, partial [Ixodes pacificus]